MSTANDDVVPRWYSARIGRAEPSVQDFASTVSMNIGWFNLSPFYYFNGILDEVALYDRALSGSEIGAHDTSGLSGQGYCNVSWGDADHSGFVDISDAVYLVSYIFGGGPAPSPLLAGDADCSGEIDISDIVYLIAYIFVSGPGPCENPQ